VTKKRDDVDEFGLGGRPTPAPAAEGLPTGEAEPADPADDAFAILGALSSKSPAFQKALAARLAKRSPIVKKVPLTKARDWSVPFGPMPVGPGQTVTALAQPQCLFRGEKIVNTGDSAGLEIEGLFVGRKSQLPTHQGPIPASVWNNSALDRGIRMDTCDPALNIAFRIMNITAATLTWAATIFGKAVL
jgi:hypothetical protein